VQSGEHCFQWLRNGIEAFAALESLIANATQSLELEMYIYKADETGQRVLTALLAARMRGVRVRLLLDAFGCVDLPQGYFDGLCKHGGEVRWFNPTRVLRFAFRNHRKLCVADKMQAIVGGFNIGDEYASDGVHSGWRDLGLHITGPLVSDLLITFEKLFHAAPMTTRAHLKTADRYVRNQQLFDAPTLLTSGPAMAGSFLRRALVRDLKRASRVIIVAAYFAPTWRLRRILQKSSRRGKVLLLLAGVSDVPVMRLAAHHLYQRLLRAGVEIFEYQPQVLHAKLLVIDDIVYVGSSNFDVRSLQLNFDFLVRIPNAQLAEQARAMIKEDLSRSRAIMLTEWRAHDSAWRRLTQWIAYWLVTRLDPLVARRKWRSLR
jgi:cardiolipin synthase A/B